MDQRAERQLQATVHHLGDRAVVVVRGEIDCGSAAELRAALDDAAVAGRVVIDLADTTFIDSSGIAVLVDLHRRLGQVREAIILERARPPVRTVLAITAMDQIMDVRDCPSDVRTDDVVGSAVAADAGVATIGPDTSLPVFGWN